MGPESRPSRLRTTALSNPKKQTEPIQPQSFLLWTVCVLVNLYFSWLAEFVIPLVWSASWLAAAWLTSSCEMRFTLGFFSVTDTCRAQATSNGETTAREDSCKHRRPLHLWKLRKTFSNARLTKPPLTFPVITRTFEKGDGNSGNTIWKLHFLDSFTAARSIHARALCVSLLDCARYFFIVYRENRLLYISHQPFNHYISKR